MKAQNRRFSQGCSSDKAEANLERYLVLQGTVNGKRRRGVQKKRWEDNITELTGMDFASSNKAAEDRTRGKGLLQSHLWCPTAMQGYEID